RAPGLLARWARRLDPEAAARIHPNDHVRLLRVLEVALATGVPLGARQGRHRFAEAPYDVRMLGLALPTAELDERLAARVDAMLASGWLDEVRALARSVPRDAPAWVTLGYRELRDVLEGRRSLAEARAATVRATRQFAKRQRTWFRGEAGVTWCDPRTERARIAALAEEFLVANPGDAG
ncbi:MAG TPA: tRNA dimethylallyltransferase, partial [Candidatus Limnocylindria bacterium]|nr:tRNA dimethylallyltransferase [Candidatus Limnocylindria bacterium]